MAVTEVGTRTLAKQEAATPISQLSISHTTTSSTDLLLCFTAIEGNETLENDEASFNSTAMTLIHDSGSTGSGSDVRVYVYGLISPDVGTYTAKVDPQFSTSPMVALWLNYSGTETSNVAAATNHISNDVNTDPTGTTVLSTGGTSGNVLLAFAVAQGGTTGPSTVNNGFSEIYDNATDTESSDFSYALSTLTSGLPSAVTVSWTGSNENSGLLLELVVATSSGTPVLSSQTDASTGSTTSTSSVTSDTADGTSIYSVVTTSSTLPTHAQIVAGTDNSDVAAAATNSKSAVVGANVLLHTGLVNATAYTTHFAQTGSTNATPVKASGFSTSANTTPVLDTPESDQTCTIGLAFGPLDVSGNFSDPNGDTLTYTATGLPKGLTISSGGIISGTPTGGYNA